MQLEDLNHLAGGLHDNMIASKTALACGKTIAGAEHLVAIYDVMERIVRRIAELESRVDAITKNA